MQLTDDVSPMAEGGEFKLVLVVNNELKMGKGKVAAQVQFAYRISTFTQVFILLSVSP